MVCWNLCWAVSTSFRKKSQRGFKLSVVFSCLKLFLLRKTVSKEQLLWLLLHWPALVTTLFYCIFHFLICVRFLTWLPCMARAVDQCSCWTRGQILWYATTMLDIPDIVSRKQVYLHDAAGHPSEPWAAALRSELLCHCITLYWGHFQSSLFSSSSSSSSTTWGTPVFQSMQTVMYLW